MSFSRSPVSLAWERILSTEVAPEHASDLAATFGRTDYISTLQFKPLHKAVLGLVSLPLEPLLACSTSETNAQDKEGRTSLLWASKRDDIDSSRLLLEYGADANRPDNRGFRPIHFARSPRSLKLLLDHSANIMAKAEAGQTPLHLASRYGRHQMIEAMIQADADPNASDAMDTPLLCATCNHQPKSTESLLKRGANPNLAAKGSGLTALHFAIIDNQHDIIQQLLSYDADCTIKAENGRTILHMVAIHGDKKTMSILSQARLVGVDPELRDSSGKTAQEYFEERCKESVPDVVKDAFTMLLGTTTTAMRELQEDDGPDHEVFHDAIEEV